MTDRPLPDGQRLVYLDSGATSQRPRRVLDKLQECYEQYNANAHRGIHPLGSRVTEEVEAAREKLRAFIGAESTEAFEGARCGAGEAPCDEVQCGPAFVACAGATRRRAGIDSDIPRPATQVWRVTWRAGR